MKIAVLLPSAPFKFRLDFRLSRALLIPKFVAQILTDGLIQDVAKHTFTTGDKYLRHVSLETYPCFNTILDSKRNILDYVKTSQSKEKQKIIRFSIVI